MGIRGGTNSSGSLGTLRTPPGPELEAGSEKQRKITLVGGGGGKNVHFQTF